MSHDTSTTASARKSNQPAGKKRLQKLRLKRQPQEQGLVSIQLRKSTLKISREVLCSVDDSAIQVLFSDNFGPPSSGKYVIDCKLQPFKHFVAYLAADRDKLKFKPIAEMQ